MKKKRWLIIAAACSTVLIAGLCWYLVHERKNFVSETSGENMTIEESETTDGNVGSGSEDATSIKLEKPPFLKNNE